jgi:hypothetical protein
MTRMGIRLSSGSRRPQSPKGLPTVLTNRTGFLDVAAVTGHNITSEVHMLAYLFVVLAVLLRVTSGTGAFATYGFSLVGASLLFFGSRMPAKQFWIPATLLIGSDIYLNLGVYHIPFTLDQILMWSWYLVPCLLGLLLRNRVKPLNVLGAGLGTGVGFFLTSNFAVWAFGNIAYAKNLAGLMECYTKAIPFARNGIISDVLFSAVFFGVGALVAQTQPNAIESKSATA